MTQTFEIPGRFCSLNEFYRADRYEQARIKREAQERVGWCAKAARLRPVEGRIWLGITYHEQNRRRDLDNISATARKFILDALQEVGVIGNDRQVREITDAIALDRREPRIVVTIGSLGKEDDEDNQ